MVFEEGRLYTVEEVAEHLHCAIRTIRKEAREGNISHHTIGKRYLFSPADISEYIKSKHFKARNNSHRA